MSNTFAEFYSTKKEGLSKQSRNMGVTAFIGDGKAIQLTLSADHDGKGIHTFITLTEYQVQKLIECLQARLDSKVTATGNEKMKNYYENHETELKENED